MKVKAGRNASMHRLFQKIQSQRTLASAVAATEKQKPASRKPTGPTSLEAKISRLPSGLTVVSHEVPRPLANLQLVFNVGSRNETPDNYGITHRLRNCIGLGTTNLLQIELGYNIAELGAYIRASSSREHMVFSVACLKHRLPECAPLLAEITLRPAFKLYEIQSTQKAMKYDRELYKTQTHLRVLDLLHKAAFRSSGLANTILSPKYMAGKHSPDMLTDFLHDNFVSRNLFLVGHGIDHELLLRFTGEALDAREGPGINREPTKFGGGEARKEAPGLAHVAIAAEGPSRDVKSLLAASVLGNVLGTESKLENVAISQTSRLARAVQKATSDPFMVSSINASYSDSGLFGLYIVAHPGSSEKVVRAALAEVKAVADGGVSDEELSRAKEQTKYEILSHTEDDQAIIEDTAVQMATTGNYVEPFELAKQVDSVTNADVQQVAKKLQSRKLAMAAFGGIKRTPYLDELV